MQNFVNKIDILAKQINRHIVLMELCGTHTEAVARHGIKKLLPKNIKLLSGPGCPVCVTDQRDIDAVIVLALEGIPIACYGDVLRVPGTIKLSKNVIARSPALARKGWTTKQSRVYRTSHGIASLPAVARNDSLEIMMQPFPCLSLDKARELGAGVTEVYSIEEALKLQKKKPNLVFFGIGFETTTPMTAIAIKRGLTVYSSHKAFVPAMEALLATPNLKIDGFINPGHVSTIIGIEPYKKLGITNHESRIMNKTKNSKENIKPIPQVIAGFEAKDVLIAIYMLLKQISENRAEVENEYTRSVRPEGNPRALELIDEVFELKEAYWRGLGKIPCSGFEIRPKYSQFDAKVKYKNILNSLNTKYQIPNTVSGCICGAILRGLKEPRDCKLFFKKCTPENPVGACMVSSEGACGIEAKFRE